MQHLNMKHPYTRASFLTSASKAAQFPDGGGIEVAFAGRSNAGKSSAINTLCQQTGLARISKTPGRTQLINFFSITNEYRLVDLPGYGYAKVPEKIRREWQQLMENYLSEREALAGLIVIMDIRHPLKDYDIQMLEWCRYLSTPCHILLTKADKLKKGPASQSLLKVKKTLKELDLDASVQIFSSLKHTGVPELVRVLNEWFGIDKNGDLLT